MEMSGKAIALIAMAAVVAIAGAVLIFGGAGNGGDGPADATVSLDRSAVEMEAGETVTVSAVVSPGGWSGTVTWTSSDPSVATVSGGKVTAVSAGDATIKARAGSSEATCLVTVKASAAVSMEISKTSLSMTAGESVTLTVSTASGQDVVWTSSDTSVAAVSGGVVTALSAGTAVITAASGSDSVTCTVSVVSEPVESDSISGFDVTCDSGTSGIASYAYDSDTGEYTVTFGTITEDTEYTVSGVLNGNIVIDVDRSETYDFVLNLKGVTISSSVSSPIVILSGDDVTLSAKKGTSNVVTDSRPAADSDVDGVYSAAVYSVVDLKLKGNGSLTVTSENNNGIHTKDDLSVKNLTLTVSCLDNALKGNDSVTVTSGNVSLYARQGDGIKTSNSETTESKQKGTVTVNSDDGDTSLTIYAACDGMDAAYDVSISETEGNSTVLNIYTDAYYSGSETVPVDSGDVLYLKVPSGLYSSGYSYYVLFSDGSSTEWAKASYLKYSAEFRTSYYYLTVDKPSWATKMALFVYNGAPSSEADSGYLYCTSQYSIPESKDMATLSSGGSALRMSFSNYATQTVGPGGIWGGMQDGNSDKTAYSAKGIKADNSVTISGGTVNISAGDDAIHANHDSEIDANTKDSYGNGKGDVTVAGGTLTLTSNDDGIHADGTLTISGGTVKVSKSYEGLEGGTIVISGGSITVSSTDDGINGVATSNEDRGSVTPVYGNITISGGRIYVLAGGDGIDSNCSSQGGLTISGGNVVVISTSSGNSAIDTDARYRYAGGCVFAICPQGMTNEMLNQTGGSYATKTGSVSSSSYVTVKYGSETLVVKMPVSIGNAFAFALYSSQPTISVSSSSDASLDSNGVSWS
jgi:hypothetical protein